VASRREECGTSWNFAMLFHSFVHGSFKKAPPSKIVGFVLIFEFKPATSFIMLYMSRHETSLLPSH